MPPVNAINQAEAQARSQLPGSLNTLFNDISARSPGAQVVVMGSWLHSVDWLNLGDSYHPTASGQSGGYYPVYNASL